jgi:hypothetical protein
MKNFVLVAGVDYGPVSAGKTPTNFLHYCNKQLEKIYFKEKNTREDINFYMVDIRRGKIELISYLFNETSGLHTKNISVYKTFDPVSKSNYFNIDGKVRFHPNSQNIISKWTIYNLIEEIGATNPKSLKELSVFSHAYLNGPILLNTNQQSENYVDVLGNNIDVVSLGYDPNDFDMRMWDFEVFYNINVRVDNVDKYFAFYSAFSDDSLIKIWGCNFWSLTNKLLAIIRTNSAYRKTGLTNDVSFNFPAYKFTDEMLNNIINPVLQTSYKVNEKITLSFLEIKKIFCRLLTFTYPYVFSRSVNKNVQAALPTTYANISPHFHIAPSLFENVLFYKNYFDIETDEEKLNYGIYEPDFTCKTFLEENYQTGRRIQTSFGEIEISDYSEHPDPETATFGIGVEFKFTPIDKNIPLTQSDSVFRWVQTVRNNYDVDSNGNEKSPAGTQVEFVDIVDRHVPITHINYTDDSIIFDDILGRTKKPEFSFTIIWQAQTSLILVPSLGNPEIILTLTWGFSIDQAGKGTYFGLKKTDNPTPFHIRAINENLPIDTYDA